MKNSLVVIGVTLFVLTWGIPCLATLNPHPDEIGIYFDTNADAVCTNVAPNIPFFAYLIITNPSAAEIQGIEFNMCVECIGGSENQLFKLSENWSAGFIELGIIYDWCLDGRQIWFFDPVPQMGDNAVIVQLSYMLLADMGVDFYLGPHPFETIEDGLPAYGDAGGVVIPLRISTGGTEWPVARVNGICDVVPAENRAFSEVKCLYR